MYDSYLFIQIILIYKKDISFTKMGRTVPLNIKRKRKKIAATIVKSSFQSYNMYVSGNELVNRIHPYLFKHVDYLVSIYPRSVAQILLKLNNKAKDKSVVLSFLKRLSIYHQHFIYKKRTTVINANKKRVSVFMYKLIKI